MRDVATLEGDVKLLKVVKGLSPLELRYMAARLLEPDKPIEEVMNDLRIGTRGNTRWSFPADVEEALSNSTPGMHRFVTERIIEANLPRAAQRLVKAIDSDDERIALTAATKILEGAGVIGPTRQLQNDPNTEEDARDEIKRWTIGELQAAIDAMERAEAVIPVESVVIPSNTEESDG